MRRSLLLCLVLVLAACDSGGPDTEALDPSVFLGEWEVTSSESRSYATLGTAQDVPDFEQPATLALGLGGDRTTSLAYVTQFSYSTDGGLLRVMDIPFGTNAAEWASLEIISDRFSWDSFELTTESGLNLYLHRLTDGDRDALRFDRLGATVKNVTVPHRGGPGFGEVVVDGRLEFATRRVEAGDEIEVPRGPLDPPPFGADVVGDAAHLAFDEEGTARATLVFSNETQVRAGTWTVEGQRLRIDLGDLGEAAFEVEQTDGLRLVSSEEQPVTESTANAFLLEPGTVDSWRRESVVELER